MVKGIVKYFSITKSVPKEMRTAHQKELEGIFQRLCEEAITDDHRAKVNVHTTQKGMRYTFTVSFGVSRRDWEKVKVIIDNLANVSMWYILAKTLQKKADIIFKNSKEKYLRDHDMRDKNHITVKPKEHIRLC